MPRRYSFLFFCLLTTVIYGQPDWYPGEIERSDGRQLAGEVRIGDEAQAIEAVWFRPAGSRTEREYSLEEVRSFRAENRRFTVRPATYNPASRTLPNMRRDRATPDQRELVVLEQLYGGIVNLFLYTDGKQNIHFYLGEGGRGPLEYLRYERQLVSSDNRDRLLGFDTYREQLAARFPGCPGAQEIVGTLTYDRAGMSKVVEELVDCSGQADQLERFGRPRGRFVVGPTAGASLVVINVPGQLRLLRDEGGGSFSAGLSPSIGMTLGYQFAGRPIRGRLRATYESFTASGVFDEVNGRPNTEELPTTVVQRTLFTNLGMTYRGNSRRPLLLDGGLILGYILKNERRGFQPLFTGPAEPTLRTYDRGADYGLSLAAGTRFGPLRVMAEASFVDRSTEILYTTLRFGVHATYWIVD